MDIVWTILIGVAVGALAKLLFPGNVLDGVTLTMALGIAGAFVARFLGNWAGWYGPNEPAAFLASIGGAVVVLILYGLLFHGRRRI